MVLLLLAQTAKAVFKLSVQQSISSCVRIEVFYETIQFCGEIIRELLLVDIFGSWYFSVVRPVCSDRRQIEDNVGAYTSYFFLSL